MTAIARRPLTVLSLFSGIGGFDLGLQRAGMNIVGQVEIDPFCRRVLAKHWPEVPRHDDVQTAVGWWEGAPRPGIDVIAGGFPCQDISQAGRRAGITGAKSGLWAAMGGVIRGLRPRYVLLENVSALLVRGAGTVLGDLAEIGYDARWDCVPASAVGAPHRRDRWWCIATDTDSPARRLQAWDALAGAGAAPPGLGTQESGRRRNGDPDVADPDVPPEGRLPAGQRGDHQETVARAGDTPTPTAGLRARAWPPVQRDSWWSPQSGMARSDDGVPAGLDPSGDVVEHWERGIPRLALAVPDLTLRNSALGNAAVPQVAEHIGNILMGLMADTGRPPTGDLTGTAVMLGGR